MNEHQKYEIRKVILAAMQQYTGVPCRADELLNHPRFRLIQPSLEELNAEWQQLNDFNYICPCEGFNRKYCRITTKGLQQVNTEFKKDPFIHGPSFAN